jgi:hypothetical protein
MDFLPQKNVVFLNSPYRVTPKTVLKKSIDQKSRQVGGWVWDLANVRGGPSILAAPRERHVHTMPHALHCGYMADTPIKKQPSTCVLPGVALSSSETKFKGGGHPSREGGTPRSAPTTT